MKVFAKGAMAQSPSKYATDNMHGVVEVMVRIYMCKKLTGEVKQYLGDILPPSIFI